MKDDRVNSSQILCAPAADVFMQGVAKSFWFTKIDVSDADKPMLPPVLQEAFRQWKLDMSSSSLLHSGGFWLFNVSGDFISAAGSEEYLHAAYIDTLLNVHVNAVETKETAHYSDQHIQAAAVPLFRRTEQQLLAVLIYVSSSTVSLATAAVEACSLHLRGCFYRAFESIIVEDILEQHKRSELEAQRRDAMYLAVRRLYNSIDVASVLTEMLDSLEVLYPDAKLHLYLSQDHLNGDPRVKPLDFRSTEQDIVTKAFIENSPIHEKDHYDCIQIAVPMAGMQAVYGVLYMVIEASKWDEGHTPAFIMLADTAGTAFEKARLYEQSNLLINELRLINELTKRLNQSLKLKDTFQFAADELLSIFYADYCCVLSYNKTKDEFAVMSSNFPQMDSEIFLPEYGFCGMINRTKEPMIISDYWTTRIVSSRLMDETGSRSLIAAPIIVNDDIIGVILLSHKQPNYFSYENLKLLQVMSTHIGLAVTNASLLSEVRRMVITDNLTGLYARSYLNEKVQDRQQRDYHGSLILVDIDHFKRVNDTYGHLVGDEILVQVSHIIRQSIRSDDIAARWGGEEIAIYLPNSRKVQAMRVAERIRERIQTDTAPIVTVSCGVAEWTSDSEKISVEALFYMADMALYEAKKNGRNKVVVG